MSQNLKKILGFGTLFVNVKYDMVIKDYTENFYILRNMK